MSFFRTRMDAAASSITRDVAAKLGGGPRRGQTGGGVLSIASRMYTDAFAQQMKRAADDARKAAYLRAKAGPSTTAANAERLARALAL